MTSPQPSAALTRLREKLAGRGVLIQIDSILVWSCVSMLDVFTMATGPGLAVARKKIISRLLAADFSVVEIADMFAIEERDVDAILKPVSPFTRRRAEWQNIGSALAAAKAGNLARGKAS